MPGHAPRGPFSPLYVTIGIPVPFSHAAELILAQLSSTVAPEIKVKRGFGLKMAVACQDLPVAAQSNRSRFDEQMPLNLSESRESGSNIGIQRWYALSIRARHEKMAAMILGNKGYESFLPLYKSKRRRPGRYRDVHLPLFPGYVFCQFDPLVRLPILTTPGVLYVVGLGKTPIPIEELELDALRRLVSSTLQAQPWPFLQAGQKVYVGGGPLEGVSGTLIAIKNRYRLVISVTLLKRSVAVEIDRSWVMPAALYPSGTDAIPDL